MLETLFFFKFLSNFVLLVNIATRTYVEEMYWDPVLCRGLAWLLLLFTQFIHYYFVRIQIQRRICNWCRNIALKVKKIERVIQNSRRLRLREGYYDCKKWKDTQRKGLCDFESRFYFYRRRTCDWLLNWRSIFETFNRVYKPLSAANISSSSIKIKPPSDPYTLFFQALIQIL